MKRLGQCFDKIVELDNLVLAAYKAFRGKAASKEVIEFRENLMDNLVKLREDLLAGNAVSDKYHCFTLREPKERLICAAPIRQRIVHHAIMNVCHYTFDRQLIYDCYATRPGKGTHRAIVRLAEKIGGYRFYAKLDFRKYFDSVDHLVLKKQLRRIIKDGRLLSLLDMIIDSYGAKEGRGIPIGNLTSQYFANYYLSSLDHYMKEVAGARVYIRYMDDVVILDNDRERLKRLIDCYLNFSTTHLGLQTKPPIIGRTCHGALFLGYRVFGSRIMMGGKSKRRFKRNVRKLEGLFEKSVISEREYADRLNSNIAHAEFADSIRFRRRFFDSYSGKICGI